MKEYGITYKILKKNQTNLKIGYSIYTVEEMLVLLDKNFIPDIIQIPYNIFDRI